MGNNLQEELTAILEEIEEAYWDEDYDEIVQRYMDIPADYWMDEALWSDQDVVWEILSNDCGALEYVSQDLLQNADFAKKLEDELDLSL